MSKSIKLKNNTYIDSTGVTHNRELLSTLLTNINNTLNDLKPVVLYSNDNGSNDNITLSDNVANYTYIEIYWKTQYNNRVYSNKLYKPNGTNSQFFYIEGADYNVSDKNHNSYVFWSDLYFNGSSIQRADAHGLTSLDANYSENGNRVFITRVLGYK